MPVKIRLMRIGAKKRPFYRVVAIDERKKRSGEYLELLGTYNPLTDPKEIILKQDKIDEWIKKGAVLSDGFLRVIKKAPQKQPRAPKKEKKAEPAKVVEEVKEEIASEDQSISESAEPANENNDVIDNAESTDKTDTTDVADTADKAEVAEITDSAEVAETEEVK